MKIINVVQAFNVDLNLLLLPTFHTLAKMGPTRGAHIVWFSSWALSACLLSLVFENTVLLCVRVLLSNTLRWLTKIRLILHAVWDLLSLIPVVAIGWDNLLLSDKWAKQCLTVCACGRIILLAA